MWRLNWSGLVLSSFYIFSHAKAGQSPKWLLLQFVIQSFSHHKVLNKTLLKSHTELQASRVFPLQVKAATSWVENGCKRILNPHLPSLFVHLKLSHSHMLFSPRDKVTKSLNKSKSLKSQCRHTTEEKQCDWLYWYTVAGFTLIATGD